MHFLKHYISSIFLFFVLSVQAGGELNTIGARQAGMANTSVTQQDVFAVAYNPAGLGFMRNSSVGIYADNRFLLGGVSLYNISGALKANKVGTFGIQFDYFGYSAYNENKIGFAYARSFGEKVSAGVKFNYMRLAIQNNGSRNTFGFEAGIQLQPIDKLRIGFHLHNPVSQQISVDFNERLNTTLKVGVSYNPSDKVMIALEGEKEINQNFRLKTGIEYKILKPLILRLGGATNPTLFTAGIGTQFKNIQLDFSSTWHLELGYSPQISFSYLFQKKEKIEE